MFIIVHFKKVNVCSKVLVGLYEKNYVQRHAC